MEIKAEIKPNKKKFKIISATKDKLVIQTKSPAKEGKANKEITTMLKKILKSKIEIIKGKTSKNKTLLVENESKLKQLIEKNKKH